MSRANLVVAFQGGGYEHGPRAAANAVPEPTNSLLLVLATTGLAFQVRSPVADTDRFINSYVRERGE